METKNSKVGVKKTYTTAEDKIRAQLSLERKKKSIHKKHLTKRLALLKRDALLEPMSAVLVMTDERPDTQKKRAIRPTHDKN